MPTFKVKVNARTVWNHEEEKHNAVEPAHEIAVVADRMEIKEGYLTFLKRVVKEPFTMDEIVLILDGDWHSAERID